MVFIQPEEGKGFADYTFREAQQARKERWAQVAALESEDDDNLLKLTRSRILGIVDDMAQLGYF